jgi:hypothetical protein
MIRIFETDEGDKNIVACPYSEEWFDTEFGVRKYCLYFQIEPDEEIDCKNCYVKDTTLELEEQH